MVSIFVGEFLDVSLQKHGRMITPQIPEADCTVLHLFLKNFYIVYASYTLISAISIVSGIVYSRRAQDMNQAVVKEIDHCECEHVYFCYQKYSFTLQI